MDNPTFEINIEKSKELPGLNDSNNSIKVRFFLTFYQLELLKTLIGIINSDNLIILKFRNN